MDTGQVGFHDTNMLFKAKVNVHAHIPTPPSLVRVLPCLSCGKSCCSDSVCSYHTTTIRCIYRGGYIWMSEYTHTHVCVCFVYTHTHTHTHTHKALTAVSRRLVLGSDTLNLYRGWTQPLLLRTHSLTPRWQHTGGDAQE